MRIWRVMDDCIRSGVSSKEQTLPGRIGLRRRAPILYRRLMRGCVTIQLFVNVLLLIVKLRIRFYPGSAGHGALAIGTGWTSESISGPVTDDIANGEEDKTVSEDDKDRGARRMSSSSSSRIPRVVGSFEHAVLPMPPVCG